MYSFWKGTHSEDPLMSETAGEEAGAEGREDSLLHPARLSHHVDPLQCPCCHEGHPWTRA